MKKTLITLGIIVGVIALAVGFSYLNDYLNQPTEQEIEEAQKQIEKEFLTPESDIPEEHKLDLIEFFPDDMTEHVMRGVIHAMSHQKVKAEQKWSVHLITKQRVERLLEIAKMNQENKTYERAQLYVEILSRWAEGDFSQAIEDHNSIWQLQNGNVGKAYALLSPVEEKQYLEQYFSIKYEDATQK